MNSHFHSATQSTPFQMMFGFTPRWNPQSAVDSDNPAAKDFSTALIQAREKAVSSLVKVMEVMRMYYDEK